MVNLVTCGFFVLCYCLVSKLHIAWISSLKITCEHTLYLSQWIGVLPEELTLLDEEQRLAFSQADHSKLHSLLARPYLSTNAGPEADQHSAHPNMEQFQPEVPSQCHWVFWPGLLCMLRNRTQYSPFRKAVFFTSFFNSRAAAWS